jgi:SAM-dependent methyltransferase
MQILRRLLGKAKPDSPVAPPPKPKAWLDDAEDRLVPERDLWIGPDDSISHYYRWIWEYLAYLVLIVGLRRDQAVLELGCGHGRTGRGLLDYLRSPGRYVGLDVDRRRIQDAQDRIQRRFPNFVFVWADIRNRHYNPTGAVEAAQYRFPFEDGTFDAAYAASLFTHLLPTETENYFRETRRVLRPGGRALFSFFLLDNYRGPGTTTSPMYEFEGRLAEWPGVAVRDAQHPDNAIAYTLDWLRTCAGTCGLQVGRVFPGLWTESPGLALNEQDLVEIIRA